MKFPKFSDLELMFLKTFKVVSAVDACASFLHDIKKLSAVYSTKLSGLTLTKLSILLRSVSTSDLRSAISPSRLDDILFISPTVAATLSGCPVASL